MKNFIMLTILALFTFTALPSQADAPWRKNKLVEKKKRAQFEEVLEEIPIYREKLEPAVRDYEIIGGVFSQDALTSKKDVMIEKMREQTYRLKGDAIMEFKCHSSAKNLFQTCEGFAIRWK